MQKIYRFHTAIIGSGCAGFNAADSLYDLGVHDIALVTEGINRGTSRNTGSDKQTYYKLSLAGDNEDSVQKLAESFHSGGSIDGRNALSEAAGSVESFFKLVGLGVPFPKNEYGEYSGYKTDHDAFCRATSCGPYTSKIMTEELEKSVRSKYINILDGYTVIRLLCRENTVFGAVMLDGDEDICLLFAENVILCTGGNASVYSRSVYPESQSGAGGLAVLSGAEFANLQEWQYGLASVKFRWNVSGTYQQVIPKYVSVDKSGVKREFLSDYLSPSEICEYTFLKGYEWPFNAKKINDSSVIDLIVYNESIKKGNRVYLDYRTNPHFLSDINEIKSYSMNAYNYLEKSDALSEIPIDRLKKMNPAAYEMYLEHGIDISKEMLEISVCAQHNNGGLTVDENYLTTIENLYCAGEAAGVFGINRPGGAALNSTQVGSRRAAEHIVYKSTKKALKVRENDFDNEIEKIVEINKKAVYNKDKTDHMVLRKRMQSEMDANASFIRDIGSMRAMLDERVEIIKTYYNNYFTSNGLAEFHKTYDMLNIQAAVLSAMILTSKNAGSRGSSITLYEDSPEKIDLNGFVIRYKKENEIYRNFKTITKKQDDSIESSFKEVTPIPSRENWFETVWKTYIKRHQL